MNVKNEVKIIFPSNSCNEAFARVAVTSVISALDPTVSEIAEIKTAVSEAVTNCIVHGYRNTAGKIELYVRLTEDNTVYIRIKDTGTGIPDIKKAMEPLYTSVPEEERAGLGFAVMENFMDRIKVTSKEGKGTTVKMYRKICSGKNT